MKQLVLVPFRTLHQCDYFCTMFLESLDLSPIPFPVHCPGQCSLNKPIHGLTIICIRTGCLPFTLLTCILRNSDWDWDIRFRLRLRKLSMLKMMVFERKFTFAFCKHCHLEYSLYLSWLYSEWQCLQTLNVNIGGIQSVSVSTVFFISIWTWYLNLNLSLFLQTF